MRCRGSEAERWEHPAPSFAMVTMPTAAELAEVAALCGSDVIRLDPVDEWLDLHGRVETPIRPQGALEKWRADEAAEAYKRLERGEYERRRRLQRERADDLADWVDAPEPVVVERKRTIEVSPVHPDRIASRRYDSWQAGFVVYVNGEAMKASGFVTVPRRR